MLSFLQRCRPLMFLCFLAVFVAMAGAPLSQLVRGAVFSDAEADDNSTADFPVPHERLPPNYTHKSSLVISPENYTDDELVELLKELDEPYRLNGTEEVGVFTTATAELVEFYANLTQAVNGTLLGVYSTAADDNTTLPSLRSCSSLCSASNATSVTVTAVSVVGKNGSEITLFEEVDEELADGVYCLVGNPPRGRWHDKREERHHHNEHHSKDKKQHKKDKRHGHSEDNEDGGWNWGFGDLFGGVEFPFPFRLPLPSLPDFFPDADGLGFSRKDDHPLIQPRTETAANESATNSSSTRHPHHHKDGKKGDRKPGGEDPLLRTLRLEGLVAERYAKENNATIQIPVIRVLPPAGLDANISVLPSGNETIFLPGEDGIISVDVADGSFSVSIPSAEGESGNETKMFSSPVVAELWEPKGPKPHSPAAPEGNETAPFPFGDGFPFHHKRPPHGPGEVVRILSKKGVVSPPAWSSGCPWNIPIIPLPFLE